MNDGRKTVQRAENSGFYWNKHVASSQKTDQKTLLYIMGIENIRITRKISDVFVSTATALLRLSVVVVLYKDSSRRHSYTNAFPKSNGNDTIPKSQRPYGVT